MTMTLAHVRPTVVTTRRARRDERGYILVTFALLLVPLLLMVGLSVDVGSWYSRASDIQKAADAAALAGVVWLPDVTQARKHALEAAERNGYKNGVNGVRVTAETVPNQDRRLRVTIEDPRVGSFFYKHFGGGDISLSRSGTAEYVMPVPLGSPEAQFGGVTGRSDTGAAPGLWGNIHGIQSNTTYGDAFASRCRGSQNCGTGGNAPNSSYRTSGYLYTIDVPANSSGQNAMSGMNIQIYDAGLFPRTNETTDTGDTNYNSANDSRKTTTTWTLYNKDSTELDVTDNPIATSTLCPNRDQPWTNATFGSSTRATWNIAETTGSSPFRNAWVSICRTTAIVPAGRYLLRVQTSGTGAGANRYAIRATTNSTSAALKPRVSAYGDMSMYNNITAGNSNFYLAEIAPEHRGKTIELQLFDPGEVTGGNADMSVINNQGQVVPSCTPSSSATGHTSFTNGVALKPCTVRTSNGNALFDGHWLTLLIPVPTNYSCKVGSLETSGANVGCWWKIRYAIGGTATDTTTWAAKVIGDPVHLVED